MAPATRRPTLRPVPSPGGKPAERAGSGGSGGRGRGGTGRRDRSGGRTASGVPRRAVLRPVPDPNSPGWPGAALAKLPLLERPLASYYLIASSAGLLLLLGLVMVLSASSMRSHLDFGSSYTVFARQATWMAIGLPILLVASRAPVSVYRKAAYPLLVVTVLLHILVLVPPFGVESNGAQRWIGAGPLTIQPSELAKLALVLWAADLLTRKRRLLGDWKHLIIPLVPMVVLLGGLIMLQPDMGTTIVVFSVLLVVLWVVGTPLRVYGALLGVVALAAALLAVVEPYRMERLLSYRDPFADAHDSGFQAVQGIYALSSGGWWGLGLGASREKWPDLLPAAHTDFILAIIGEELGLLGTLVVVALFGVLGYAGLRVAHRANDLFVRLAAAASTGWILTQAIVNMGAVVGLVPITGIPLPMVSFGGSSLLPTMLTIGMLLAFARSEPAAAELLARRARQRRGTWLARRLAAIRATPNGGQADGGRPAGARTAQGAARGAGTAAGSGGAAARRGRGDGPPPARRPRAPAGTRRRDE
ncbi:MAG: putative lipid II flippase FtsW [Frankia sp.]|nr:putative lipid II flippase FtsW [Frankia sp.]